MLVRTRVRREERELLAYYEADRQVAIELGRLRRAQRELEAAKDRYRRTLDGTEQAGPGPNPGIELARPRE